MSTTPVTLLTGFLGSGKTTLVNRLLTEQVGQRIAVIVNEFGELGIDAALIASREDDDVVELANGCVCCASRGDLVRAVETLVSPGRGLDHVLIEGSGMVDPGPVVESLVSPPLSQRLTYTGTVTCVDAANFDANLEHAEAAYNQLTHADLLIINKADLVSFETLELIGQGLRRINTAAPQVTTVRCAVPAQSVLAPLQATNHRAAPTAHDPESHAMTGVTVRAAGELDGERLRSWLGGLPRSVVRAKGIVYLTGSGTPRVVQVVSGAVELGELPAGSTVHPERSALVLIGTGLDEDRLRRGFAACIA
jgi:G3E family GTPase